MPGALRQRSRRMASPNKASTRSNPLRLKPRREIRTRSREAAKQSRAGLGNNAGMDRTQRRAPPRADFQFLLSSRLRDFARVFGSADNDSGLLTPWNLSDPSPGPCGHLPRIGYGMNADLSSFAVASNERGISMVRADSMGLAAGSWIENQSPQIRSDRKLDTG